MRTIDDPRWQQIVARDPAGDGRFWYSVTTTGIYCRPACPSRRPAPAHVLIHDSVDAARAVGARACRRCDPDGLTRGEQQAAMVADAVRTIEAAVTPPALAVLADAAGVSPGYFHRMFKAETGMTPKAYATAVRATRVRNTLAQAGSVTEAMYEAGYEASARFYADAPAMLGMTPTRFRAGGKAETLGFTVSQTTLGTLLVAFSTIGVAAILMGDDADALIHDLRRRFPAATLIEGDRGQGEAVAEIVRMVEQPSIGVNLPLDIRGTAFQCRVWQALRMVPAGQTVSYAQLAAAIGSPAAMRAVAGACAANAHAIAIPCHRVLRSNGDLSGYRWGVERKARLIEAERSALSSPKADRRISLRHAKP